MRTTERKKHLFGLFFNSVLPPHLPFPLPLSSPSSLWLSSGLSCSLDKPSWGSLFPSLSLFVSFLSFFLSPCLLSPRLRAAGELSPLHPARPETPCPGSRLIRSGQRLLHPEEEVYWNPGQCPMQNGTRGGHAWQSKRKMP